MDTVFRIARGLASRLRNLGYRGLGMHIEGRAWLRKIEAPSGWMHICLGDGAALDHGVQLVIGQGADGLALRVGKSCYVNRFTTLEAHRSLTIGEGCLIGPYCYLTDAEHGVAPEQPVREQPLDYRPTLIEDNVWIGAHVTVRAGVSIGQGAVIGAGSVVTSDIPPMAIAFGSPAKVHRQR